MILLDQSEVSGNLSEEWPVTELLLFHLLLYYCLLALLRWGKWEMGNLFGKKKRPYERVGLEDLSSEEEGIKVEEKKKQTHTRVLLTLMPYLWPKGDWAVRVSVVVSLALMVLGKLCTVSIPLVYRNAVDILTQDDNINHDLSAVNSTLTPGAVEDGYDVRYLIHLLIHSDHLQISQAASEIIFPFGWILLYGILKFSTNTCADLRDTVFIRVTQSALRSAALNTFQHLHQLSLRFHLHRQTGGILRAIERGTQGISFLLTFVLFNIGPTLLEIVMVCTIMLYLYTFWFALITFSTMVLYVVVTLSITQWRIKFRRVMNDLNNDANNKAVDSLLNFETVKYFSNEEHEANRYGESMSQYCAAAVKSQGSLMLLNGSQALIMAVGISSVMLLAAWEVSKGRMTVGDFVLVNSYLMQLAIPLNFLGTSYRMIKSSLVDLESMFALLDEPLDVSDQPNATDLKVSRGHVRFENVTFSYGPGTSVFQDISFDIPPGNMLAIVGPTGAGKSTISKLIFRFYDVTGGSISMDESDIRHVSQSSLRRNIGVVPQDTVLFNDTIRYNIAYGNLHASEAEIQNAAVMAQIHGFIMSQPDGYDTKVGERGLRLSGGEKQRIAIARAILKNPPIMLFDEATSALDSKTEREIQAQLKQVSKGRTTIVIAHRLSTIVDANEIIVLKNGTIAERGTHSELLDKKGEYAEMWARQQEGSSVVQNLEISPDSDLLSF